jgi:CHAT domain
MPLGLPLRYRGPSCCCRRAVTTALGAAVALGIAVICCRPSSSHDGRQQSGELSALVRATSAFRFVEPRLSGGFAYAPCAHWTAGPLLGARPCSAPPTRGSRDYEAIRRAAGAALGQAQRHPSPRTLQMAALARLSWQGSSPAIGAAVAQLEQAAARSPRDGAILSDLAAAYYVRAQREIEPYDLLRALAAANRAIAAAPTLAEARFNRALALEALFVEADARRAWQDYLDLDSGSGWADEAASHLTAFNLRRGTQAWDEQLPALTAAAGSGDLAAVRRIVGRFHQEAREHAERELLVTWAEASLAGRNAAATHALQAARSIGEGLAADHGDRLVRDAVGAIDAAHRHSDHALVHDLAQGHVAFHQGYLLYDTLDNARAVERLAAAREALTRAGSPFAAQAEFFRACALLNMGQHAAASRALEQLGKSLAGQPYPSLLGHVAWMQGLTRFLRGDPMGSLAMYETSLGLLRRAGEAEDAGVVESLLPSSLEFLGRSREAWHHCYLGLAAARSFRHPRHRFTASVQAADFNLRNGEPDVALAFQDDVVQFALSSAPAMLADARLWRALMLGLAGARTPALAQLKTAELSIARDRDVAARRRNEADLSLVEGHLLAETEPRRAAVKVSRALDLYSGIDHRISALLAYRIRARAYRRLGDQGRAEADLRSALAAYRKLGEGITTQEKLPAFLAQTSDLFDEVIAFEAIDRQRADRAFEDADRARTQVIPAFASEVRLAAAERRQLLAAEPRPASLTGIVQRLPASTALVQYSVLKDRLLVWVLRRGGMQFFVKPLGEAGVQDLVMRWRRFGPDWKRTNAELSDLLLSPWLVQLRPGNDVVLVPDKSLLAVPFACLTDRTSGRYLVDSHRLLVAPSASLFVAGLARKGRSAGPRARARGLVVGDPAFDSRSFPELARLPGAEAEARAVAALYPAARLLVGKAAHKREFLARVRHSSWAHYSGHAIVNLQNPLLSMLALAPTPGGDDSGALFSWEIYRLDLGTTGMVVLSACGTNDVSSGGAGGVSSLARAFLAAGVPVVVASLWDVDDRSSARFLVAFHSALRGGLEPGAALRQAQLAFLASAEAADRHPSVWGAFEVLAAGTF